MAADEITVEAIRQARHEERQQSSPVDRSAPTILDQAAEADDLDPGVVEQLTTELVNRRVGKIVKMASFDAADRPVDDDGLTEREKVLLGDISRRITEYREEMTVTANEASDE